MERANWIHNQTMVRPISRQLVGSCLETTVFSNALSLGFPEREVCDENQQILVSCLRDTAGETQEIITHFWAHAHIITLTS